MYYRHISSARDTYGISVERMDAPRTFRCLEITKKPDGIYCFVYEVWILPDPSLFREITREEFENRFKDAVNSMIDQVEGGDV